VQFLDCILLLILPAMSFSSVPRVADIFPVLQVTVALDAVHQPQLDSIWAAMQRLSAAGQTDSPDAKRLVNEYRQATGKEVVARIPVLDDFVAEACDEIQHHCTAQPNVALTKCVK
jgi:hypothetical protein